MKGSKWSYEREIEGCHDWHHVETDIFRTLLLWQEVWYRAGSQPGRPLPHVHVYSLAALWMPECLTFWGWKTHALYIFWTSTHISFLLNSLDSFPLSLVYTCAYPVLKSLTNQSVKGQYITDAGDQHFSRTSVLVTVTSVYVKEDAEEAQVEPFEEL